jgi:hypothetical protein
MPFAAVYSRMKRTLSLNDIGITLDLIANMIDIKRLKSLCGNINPKSQSTTSSIELF